MNGLSEAEAAAFSQSRAFLESIEKTEVSAQLQDRLAACHDLG